MAKTYQLGPARRAVNVLMEPLVRLGIGGKSTYLLTTTGRRTGQQRTTPVILVENDEERWLVSPYGMVAWVTCVPSPRSIFAMAGERRRFTPRRSAQLQPAPSSSVTFATFG